MPKGFNFLLVLVCTPLPCGRPPIFALQALWKAGFQWAKMGGIKGGYLCQARMRQPCLMYRQKDSLPLPVVQLMSGDQV